MAHIIRKLAVATGETVRIMPVMYPTAEYARLEANALNQQYAAEHRYVADETHSEVLQFVIGNHGVPVENTATV